MMVGVVPEPTSATSTSTAVTFANSAAGTPCAASREEQSYIFGVINTVTSTVGVLIAALTLAFMVYKYLKGKRRRINVPTIIPGLCDMVEESSNTTATDPPTNNDILYLCFILVYIVSTAQSRDPRPTTQASRTRREGA